MDDNDDQLRTKESGKEQYHCNKCGKVFSYLANLSNHVKSGCKSLVKKITCPSCNLILERKNIARHLKTHQNTMLHCTKCTKKFKSKEGVDRHMKIHKQINCNLCDMTFGRQKQFKKHTREAHSTRKTLKVENKKCEDCDKVFSRPWRLRQHQQTVHGQTSDATIQQVFKCKYCNALVQSDTEIKKHLKIYHRDISFECEDCKSIFFTKKAWIRHMNHHLVTRETNTEVMKDPNKNITDEELEIPNENNQNEGEESSTKDKIDNVDDLPEGIVSGSLKVGKRIKQNLLEVDLDEASDEDISYVPPKGIFGQIVSASILIHPYFSRYKVEST